MTGLPEYGLSAWTSSAVSRRSWPNSPSLAWLTTAIWGILCTSISGVYAGEPSYESSSNRRARIENAIRSIPFESIDRESSNAIKDVLNNPSFYRQLPQRTLDCDPQLLNFMVRHPEVMVNIWELVGITNITAMRTGNRTFSADDGAGTKCNCELIYSDNATHVYYGSGNYDGMLMPRTIKGRVVCVLRSSSQPNNAAHSGYNVISTMDVFLKVDNIGADLLTRTMGPLVGKVTDHNFEETSKFVSQFSEFCAHYPNAAQSLAGHLRVSNESIRQEFLTIASRVGRPVGRVDLSRDAQPSEMNIAASTSLAESRVGSKELQNSLGTIRVATLPDLMVSADMKLDDNSGSQVPMDFSEGSAQQVSLDADRVATGEHAEGTASSSSADTYSTRHGGVMPRRSGLTLRR